MAEQLALVQKVAHYFPLRPDLIVRMELPAQLTREDANRLSEFVRSLAFQPEDLETHA